MTELRLTKHAHARMQHASHSVRRECFRAGMARRAQADDGQCVLLPCGEILDEVAARHGAKLCCAERRTGPPQGPEGFDSRLRPPPSGKAANEDKAMNESGITQADGESLVAACHPEAAVPAQPQ